MQKKYPLDTLIKQYLKEIKALSSLIQSPNDESKLQQYYQAANAFRGISIGDMVKFALSLGRSTPGKSAQMRQAFPVLLGNRVTRPTRIDLAYAKLLLAYVIAFRAYRKNLKEWLLRFVLSSRFSPLHSFIEHEIAHVIHDTKKKIHYYSTELGE